MRKYTEPVAELSVSGIMAAMVWRSWLLPTAVPPPATPMLVNHWVDCEGFKELCILVVGVGGAFSVVPYFFPEAPPAAGQPDPTLSYYVSFPSMPTSSPTALIQIVSQIMPLSGVKAVGLEINDPVNGAHATAIEARAFLRGEV